MVSPMFIAPYEQHVRYTGPAVVLSATPPKVRIEKGALGHVKGPSNAHQGRWLVEFDDVSGTVAVSGASLELIEEVGPTKVASDGVTERSTQTISADDVGSLSDLFSLGDVEGQDDG